MEKLENKVENKSIIQIDIEKWIPKDSELKFLDVKEFLFKEMILKESEFRQAIDLKDWEDFRDKITFIYVSNQAIIPQWAWLIFANKLAEVNSICIQKTENYRELALLSIIDRRDLKEFEGKRVFIKGCGNEKLSQQPFILIAQKLTPIVKALAFGESCSSVPLFKN